MNNNKNKDKKRVIPIVLIIIAIVVMLPIIINLFITFLPILILVLFGFLIFSLIKLIRKPKTAKITIPQEEQPQQPVSPQQPENELILIQKSFSLLQRRITEQLSLEYPGARWVWGAPNAIERFKNNEFLIVLLNSAGGYNKAQVVVHDMLFKGMKYFTLEPQIVSPAIPTEPVETKITNDSGDEDDTKIEESDISGVAIIEDMPVNYGRLAFEWVDANMLDINAKYNEAIAQNKSEMLIPAAELPHPDSWPDLCDELKHNGFSVADFCEDGIKVNITK